MKISLRDERAVLEVIDLCASLEEKALEIYESLLALAENDKMRSLWSAMIDDEKSHRAYWLLLKEVCAAGGVPEVFDEPRRYVDELEALALRLDHVAVKISEDHSVPNVFIHALKLEFLLLHPSFVTLFHYLPEGPDQTSPSRTYEQHLGRLLLALMDFEQLPPELELLGEAIGRIWKASEEGATRAVTDSLTGCLNRRGLYLAMKPLAYLARREKETAGVMLVELRNLKAINTRHGHRIGDRVLAEAAKVISSRLRASDVIGRFGGDDFLALLTRFNPEHFERIGREIITRVRSITAGDDSLEVLVGGSSTFMGDDVSGQIESLIREADRCLDEARAGKGDCIVKQY